MCAYKRKIFLKYRQGKYTVTMVLLYQNEDSRFKRYLPGKTDRF